MVVTANVLRTLDPVAARGVLAGVIAEEPDLVALQEWDLPRLGLLRGTGHVRLLPAPGISQRRSCPDSGYVWCAPLLGGCVVGAKTDRYDLTGCRVRLLSMLGRGDNPGRPFGIEPPRIVSIGTYRDRQDGRTTSLLSFHLVPGVQARGRYRDDRPLIACRHRREVRRLQSLVDERLAEGHVVYAAGDSNFDGLRLRGLVSAWEGRDDGPGTHGPFRKIDDVHGPGRASSVTLLANASDHKAVVVTWDRP